MYSNINLFNYEPNDITLAKYPNNFQIFSNETIYDSNIINNVTLPHLRIPTTTMFIPYVVFHKYYMYIQFNYLFSQQQQ